MQSETGRRSIIMAKLSVVFLAVLLVIPAALSSKARKGQYGLGPKDEEGDEDRVWLIAQGIIGSRANYLDPLTGMKKGYEVDVLNAVCEIAGKDCQIVEDQFSNCWTTVEGVGPVGGAGLFNFYYDACIGWNPTYTRARTFQFSGSFAKNRGSVFIVPSGNSEGFDWTDLTGKTIGIIAGFVSDDACIMRASDDITGAELSADQIVYYSNPAELSAGVIAGEVDAGFDSIINYPEGIEIGSDFIFCALGGNAMMTRKDSGFVDWFDPALEELLASDQYQEVCDNLTGEHGDQPGPGPEDICIE